MGLCPWQCPWHIWQEWLRFVIVVRKLIRWAFFWSIWSHFLCNVDNRRRIARLEKERRQKSKASKPPSRIPDRTPSPHPTNTAIGPHEDLTSMATSSQGPPRPSTETQSQRPPRSMSRSGTAFKNWNMPFHTKFDPEKPTKKQKISKQLRELPRKTTKKGKKALARQRYIESTSFSKIWKPAANDWRQGDEAMTPSSPSVESNVSSTVAPASVISSAALLDEDNDSDSDAPSSDTGNRQADPFADGTRYFEILKCILTCH